MKKEYYVFGATVFACIFLGVVLHTGNKISNRLDAIASQVVALEQEFAITDTVLQEQSVSQLPSKSVEPVKDQGTETDGIMYQVAQKGEHVEIRYSEIVDGAGFTLSYPKDEAFWGIPQLSTHLLAQGGSPNLSDYPRLVSLDFCAQHHYCNMETGAGPKFRITLWNSQYKGAPGEKLDYLAGEPGIGNPRLLGKDNTAIYVASDYIDQCREDGYCQAGSESEKEMIQQINRLLNTFKLLEVNEK